MVFQSFIPMPMTLNTVQRYFFFFLLNHHKTGAYVSTSRRPPPFPIKQKILIFKNDNIIWKRPEETCLHCTSTWRRPKQILVSIGNLYWRRKFWWLESSVHGLPSPAKPSCLCRVVQLTLTLQHSDWPELAANGRNIQKRRSFFVFYFFKQSALVSSQMSYILNIGYRTNLKHLGR